MKRINMIKRNISIPVFIVLWLLPLSLEAQTASQGENLKREVTLYNPYKPSLPTVRKRSFLPVMNDTMKIRPEFRYDIKTIPFMPEYTISPIKAAALLPDPLPKLYKSYVKIGLGNYLTPLAEISITNERSKKGTLGFYGRHFSTNGKVKLLNDEKAFAGYMDNDVSVFGRKFFRKNILEGSVDFAQKTRYAYGYDTSFVDYAPENKDIRLNYNNIGAKGSFASTTTDSSEFSYDFDLSYDFLYNASNLYQHSVGFSGVAAKTYKGFYIGSGIGYDFYQTSDSILTDPKYIASISPFIKKSTEQWSFMLGFQALTDKNIEEKAKFHIYPDINFGFSIVPSYIRFFAGLSGKLEKNEPLKIISENPFLKPDGSLFKLNNTDHQLIVKAGLKGNTGLDGSYQLSVSYSMISDMPFYSNIVFRDIVLTPGRGNYFEALKDDVDLLNIHGEMSGAISDKISFYGAANINKYTMTSYEYAWNKPGWDSKLGVKYNLRDKIIAGIELTGVGKRNMVVNGKNLNITTILPLDEMPGIFEMPEHFNLNMNAEYRYSRILSFWTSFNNISYNKYNEWVYYPSQRFLFMLGFTYSL